MFERFTEQARRTIFFARYEASNLGVTFIETEHLLLGLLRQDKRLAVRFLHSAELLDSIREQIKDDSVLPRISTSVDMPLSHESKRVLAYAAEEMERLNHRHIGTEHLLLGLLREENGLAARMLVERGLSVASVREELRTSPPQQVINEPRPRRAPVFKLTAVKPNLTNADPSNPMGFHEVRDRTEGIRGSRIRRPRGWCRAGT